MDMRLPCVLLAGKPTSETIGWVGLLAMDTNSTNGDIYKCIRAMPGSYTWMPVDSSVGILMDTKLDKNQGIDNAGRLLYIGDDGVTVPIALGDGLYVREPGKNIFNGEGEWENGYWRNTDGKWIALDSGTAFTSVRKKYPVEGGATYAASVTEPTKLPYISLSVQQYDADGGFISSADVGAFTPTVTKNVTFSVGADTAYIGISVYSDGQAWEDIVPVGFMVEKGTVSTEYEPFGSVERTLNADGGISGELGKNALLYAGDDGEPECLDVGDGLQVVKNSRKNLFHGAWENAKYVNGIWSNMTDGLSWAAVNQRFPVEPSTVYVMSAQGKPTAADPNLFINEYDADGNFIVSNYGMHLKNHDTRTYTTGDSTAYITVHIYGGGLPAWETLLPEGFMIEKGSAATEYEPYWAHDKRIEVVKQPDNILTRNTDVLPMVQAAARRGYNGQGQIDQSRQPTFLATTDLHGGGARFDAANLYMDSIPEIDCGICLGDMQTGYFTDNDGTWFTDRVNAAKKKIYPVIGNHDAGMTNSPEQAGSKQQQFDKFFAPVLDKLGMPDLTKTYYSFTLGTVTVIVLDIFDAPDTLDENGNFVWERVYYGFSQEQITWLVDTLENVPAENHVLIAIHVQIDPTVMDEGSWTHMEHHINGGENTGFDYTNMIPEIVDAWTKGEDLQKTYAPLMDPDMPTLTADAAFASRGTGVFAGYLRGHAHSDAMAHVRDYPTQKVYSLDTTALDSYNNGNSDLPRVAGEKSEDCVTVVTVDTVSRKVKLVRIGSNITFDMVRRDMIAVEY